MRSPWRQSKMHHRKPNRLKNYDYSRAGYYFVTICTKNRVAHFGNVVDGKMVLNEEGQFANQYWLEIPDHFDLSELDRHVVMPNHLHGIVIIHDTGDVGNAYMHSLQHSQQVYDRTKMLLSRIIQQYKAAVTREISKSQPHFQFQWQKSFYDHIIRNDISLFRIRKYIDNNPLKWEYDQENLNKISIEQKKKFWKDFLKNL